MQAQSDKLLRTRRKRKIQRKRPGESPLSRTTHVSCPPSVSPLRENMFCDVWRAWKWYVQHFFFFFTFRTLGRRVEMFLHKHFLWTGMGWTFTFSGWDTKHVKLFFHQTLCRFEPQDCHLDTEWLWALSLPGPLFLNPKLLIMICSNMDRPGDDHTKWSRRKTNVLWYHFYVESKKIKQMNLFTKHTYGYQRGEQGREG